MTQKITPFLWFDGNAEEAAKHYVSIFKNGKITSVTRYGSTDAVMTVSFELEGVHRSERRSEVQVHAGFLAVRGL
jgi:predicted 3-demethylubiquinone-9 3-methyltransferase (glyoxalase superfamily)